jgi:S-DNA-T family DNA segregation ATPase FtsK/SpoIIIE
MSLTRIFNKTPLYNEKSKVYEIDAVHSRFLQQVIQSRFIGEGVYGIEQFSMPGYKESYLFTPPFDKFGNDIQKVWYFDSEDLNEISIFELRLEKPMFMPLNTEPCIDLFNTIANLEQGSVFSQVLFCKRMDNWRETAITQYETYLKGNDNPLENKFTIKIQEKMLGVLGKIGNFAVNRTPIEEMEQKILQTNYRFECRFLVYEKKHMNTFISNVENALQKLHFFNEFSLKMVNNKRNLLKLIVNREFQPYLVNQLMSEQEVYSLLGNEKLSEARVELEKPIKHKTTFSNLEKSMTLQKALQLMPFNDKRKNEIDMDKAKQLNEAFKRIGIVKSPMKVTEMYQGSSLLKVQMEMPPDMTFSKINNKTVDLHGAMANEGITIEIGDKPNTINVLIPLEKRDVVYFRNLLESEEFQEFRKNNPLPFVIGESVNGGFIFGCLSQLRHLLIAGTTGSGKSVFLNLIIICFLLTIPPDELSLYLIDPKKIELTNFDGFPQVKHIITDMKKATGLLFSLCEEMENRYELFSKVDGTCKELATYNQKADEKLPYIVCVIDEFADLIMVNKHVEEYVVRLGQKARAAGIHLIIATQRPSVDVITGLIKANLPNRIAFAVSSQTDSRTILDKGGAEKLLGRGDGLAMIEGSKKELERFQSPVLTLKSTEEDKIYEDLRELFKDIQVFNHDLPEVKVEEPIEQLKRIIATTGELRVSELGKLMGIATAKLKALLEELVDEDWLLHEGKGRPYELNVDEEELNKWR